MLKISVAALAFAAFLAPDVALAQYYPRGGYYQPRVYYSPPPRYSRDAYQAGGALIGGGVGLYYRSPSAALAGSVGGNYYGGRYYDYQRRYTTQYSYYPRAYGVQTTTPYMTRTVPRY